MDLIHTLGNNLQTVIENGGYFLLMVIIILEGIPIIGQMVPGQTILFISGFLVKLGVFDLTITIIIVSLSAIFGDYLGYVLGRKYGMMFIYKFGSLVFIKQEYIDKARDIIRDNSVKAILLGRFNPITRSLTPFVVGASGVHSKKFWIFDSIGAVTWVIAALSIGYIFGASYHIVAPLFGKYIVIATIIAVLMIWGYRFINKNFHIFAKYELITLFLNILGLYLFFKTIQDALTDKMFLLQLDLFANDYFIQNTTRVSLYIMNTLTNIFSPSTISIVGLVGLIYFLYKKKYTYSIITFTSIAGGYVFTFIIKNIVDRIRPVGSFIAQGGYSFPSGHAVAITIFSTLVIYFFIIKIKNIVLREALISVLVILVLLVSFSRIYLGVHWVSDVIAGIGFGLFWTTTIVLLVKYLRLVVGILRK